MQQSLLFHALKPCYFQPEAGEAGEGGGLAEHAHFFHVEVGEDLRADTVGFAVPLAGLVFTFGQGAVEQGGAVFGAVQQDGDAVFGSLDALKGLW